jgi:hypothetical protein
MVKPSQGSRLSFFRSISTSPDAGHETCHVRTEYGARLFRIGKDWPVSVMRRPAASIHALILTAILTGPGQAFAQLAAVEVPANATAARHGSRWTCDQGYRKLEDACAPVALPANAYLTNSAYGPGWACRRGYRAVDEACVAIAVPPNAYLDSLGERWECDRGYRKVAESCIAIDVPPNGYLTNASYGTGWTCERGYVAVGDACLAVQLPENAHLDYSGHGWDCDPPYREQQDRCALP